MTDDINIRIGILLTAAVFLEFERSAVGNCAKIFLHFITAHTDAIIDNAQDPVFLVRLHLNAEIIPADSRILILQTAII